MRLEDGGFRCIIKKMPGKSAPPAIKAAQHELWIFMKKLGDPKQNGTGLRRCQVECLVDDLGNYCIEPETLSFPPSEVRLTFMSEILTPFP